jgi:hypothetical protein
LFVIDGAGVTGELLGLRLVLGYCVALGQELADQTVRGWVVAGLRGGVSACGVEGWCGWAISGGGQSQGSGGLELSDGWNDGEAGFGDFGDEVGGELDGGEECLGYGALDASVAKSLDDLVEGGESGRLVDKGREMERF